MSQLTNYIEKELSRGFSKELIKQRLLQAGYSEQAVEDSFKVLEGKSEVIVRKQPIDTIHHDHKVIVSKILFGALAIGLLVGLSILLMNVMKQQTSEPKPEELIAHCLNLTIEEKDACILLYAKEEQTIEVCSFVTHQGLKTLCDEKQWERTDCTYDTMSGAGAECMIQKAITEGIGYCYQTSNPNTCKEQVAIQTNNMSICGEDPECKGKYAIAKNTPEICENLSSTDKKLCYRTYALTTQNKGYCQDSDLYCTYSFAKTPEEKEEAVKIYKETTQEESIQQERTFIKLAKQSKDELLCSYVSQENYTRCKQNIEEA